MFMFNAFALSNRIHTHQLPMPPPPQKKTKKTCGYEDVTNTSNFQIVIHYFVFCATFT